MVQEGILLKCNADCQNTMILTMYDLNKENWDEKR